MDIENRKQLITERFYKFKNKLVDEYPEYRKSFDDIISKSYDKDLLWHVLEDASIVLNTITKTKCGENNLIASDYYKSLEFAYDKYLSN